MSKKKKVVFVGDVGCGKTRLLESVCGGKFDPGYEATVTRDTNVVFETVDRKGNTVELKVTLSDTSGDEAYDRLRPLSYLDTDLIILCFSLSAPLTLRSVSERWSSELGHFLPGVPVILVGCKRDLRDSELERGEKGSAGSKEICTAAESEEEEDEVDFSRTRCVRSDRGRLLCWHLGAECYLETSAAAASMSSGDDGVQDLREAMFDALLAREESRSSSSGKRRWKRAARMVRM